MTDPQTPRVLLLHWGSSGAGPRLLRVFAESLASVDVSVLLSYARNADTAAALDSLALPSLTVVTYSSTVGLLLSGPRWLLACLRLRRFLRNHEVTVVVSPMLSLWQSLGLCVWRPRGVAYVSSIHDVRAHIGEESLIRDSCRDIEISAAAVVIVYSASAAVELAGIAPGKTILQTVHPAFDGGRGSISPRHRPPKGAIWTLGFFGRIAPYKGIDLFTEAVGILRLAGAKVNAQIVGDGVIDPQLDLHGVTVRSEWIDEDVINEVVASFDLLVLPYREASQSGVLAIAMAEGVPAVVTPVGGLVEQIAESGGGVVASDVSARAIAEAVWELMESPDEVYQSMSARSLESASSTHSSGRLGADLLESIRLAHEE